MVRFGGLRAIGSVTLACTASACGGPSGEPLRPETTEPPPAAADWVVLGELPGPVEGFAALASAEFLYVAGGAGPSGAPSAHFARLRVRERTWEALPELPRGVRDAHLMGWFDDVFLIGGIAVDGGGEAEVLPTLYRYVSASRTWTRLADAPTPLTGGLAGIMDRHVAVIGALTDVHGTPVPVGAVPGYDPDARTWRMLEPTIVHRIRPSGSSSNGDVTVFGGLRVPDGEPVHLIEHRHNFVWHRVAEPAVLRIGGAGVRVRQDDFRFGGLDLGGVPVQPYGEWLDDGRSLRPVWVPLSQPTLALPVTGHLAQPFEREVLLLGGRLADGSPNTWVVSVTLR